LRKKKNRFQPVWATHEIPADIHIRTKNKGPMRRFPGKIPFLFLAFFLLAAGAQAQLVNAVKWKNSISKTDGLKVGEEVSLMFKATIKPGYHIYAASLPKESMAMPAIFGLDDGSAGVEAIGDMSEKGDKHVEQDEYLGPVAYYEGTATFTQKIKLTAKKGKIIGYVNYQVCDSTMCIPAYNEFEYTLVASDKPEEARPAETTPKPDLPVKEKEIKPDTPDPKETPEEKPGEKSENPDLTPDRVPQNGTGNVDKEGADVQFASLENPGENLLIEAVKWSNKLDPEGTPEVGDTVILIFFADIIPGFKVYSTVPPEGPANMPTVLKVDPASKGIELVGGLEEEGIGKTEFDPVFKTYVRYFENEVTFKQKVRITESNPVLEGFLDYQFCTKGKCIPAKNEFSFWEYKVGSRENLLALLLKGLLFGLLAVFTPCVFPLIPLTVSFFTKQSTTRSKGIRNAAVYGLSIVFIYTFLGLVISILFGKDAMYYFSVNPWVNLAIFSVIFLFGLSFLGWFEVTLPSAWSTAIGKQSDRGGVIGIFLMALTLAIVSFSCTGPIVALAFADAADGAFLSPAVIMLGFSTALALPFVLFALFPGWLNTLPKSGGWLNSVKVVLGFLEVAFALIYLSKADLVWHLGLLEREVFLAAWVVIFAMLGLYLLGKLQLPHDSPVDKVSIPRLLMAMSSFWFMLYLLPGLWGAPLKLLGGYIPSINEDMGVILQSSEKMYLPSGGAAGSGDVDICTYPDKILAERLQEHTPRGFCAFYDLEQGLQFAKEKNKPVFLDFTGHTCANCRFLESNLWPESGIKRYLTEEYVLISLYVDDQKKLDKMEVSEGGQKLRTVGDKWRVFQMEHYNFNAQPFYVLMDHDGSNLGEPRGYGGGGMSDALVKDYSDYLESGLQEFRRRHTGDPGS
jgi:thiol:disulfide interchange protein DsbD